MTTALAGGSALLGASLEHVADCVLVVEDATIAAAGPSGDVAIPPGAGVVDASCLTLLPGFVDAHIHIALASPREVRDGGVTYARDLAWTPEGIWPLVTRSRAPDFDGPRLAAVGQMLTVEGGYPTTAAWAPEGVGRIVRSAGDADATVAEQADSGACAIKVALDAAAGPTLSLRTLTAIADAAHARRLPVTAHVTGLDELNKSMEAGIDELAHILMSEERIPDDAIARLVGAGIVVVPTLSCRSHRDLDIAIDNLRKFLDAGGRVVYGTDLGNEGPRPGIDHNEITGMAAAGMNPKEIIASATTAASEHLGLPSTGVLAPGKDADVIGVRGDPTTDVDAITNVALVVRSGRVAKND